MSLTTLQERQALETTILRRKENMLLDGKDFETVVKELAKDYGVPQRLVRNLMLGGALPPKTRAKAMRNLSASPDEGDTELRIDWATPQPGWENLDREFDFSLDAAASAANTKCKHFYDGLTPETDGLLQPWFLWGTVWINPPYNPKGEIERWLLKALEECAKGVSSVFLIPMASSRGYFNDIIVPYGDWWTFNGRIAFDDPLQPQGAPRTSPKQDNLLVHFYPGNTMPGWQGVRDKKTFRCVGGPASLDKDWQGTVQRTLHKRTKQQIG
jgi:phage N-6-adenine-methyltransferase